MKHILLLLLLVSHRSQLLRTRWTKKTLAISFTACYFRSTNQIGTKFGTNQRYFILNTLADPKGGRAAASPLEPYA